MPADLSEEEKNKIRLEEKYRDEVKKITWNKIKKKVFKKRLKEDNQIFRKPIKVVRRKQVVMKSYFDQANFDFDYIPEKFKTNKLFKLSVPVKILNKPANTKKEKKYYKYKLRLLKAHYLKSKNTTTK